MQSRDFTHVDNVILANELAGTTTNPDAFGEVFNVACGKAVVLTDLVSTLKEELAQFDSSVSKVGVVNGPERIGDIKHSLASIDKISRILGYQPVTHFNEGIKKNNQLVLGKSLVLYYLLNLLITLSSISFFTSGDRFVM